MNVNSSSLVIETEVDGTYKLEKAGIVPSPLSEGMFEFNDERFGEQYGMATKEEFKALLAERKKSVNNYDTACALMKRIGKGCSKDDAVLEQAVFGMNYALPSHPRAAKGGTKRYLSESIATERQSEDDDDSIQLLPDHISTKRSRHRSSE